MYRVVSVLLFSSLLIACGSFEKKDKSNEPIKDPDGDPPSGEVGPPPAWPKTQDEDPNHLAANRGPVIRSTPEDQQVEFGQDVYIDISAFDEDGDLLSFSMKGAPKNATIDDGKFKWRAEGENEGEDKTYDITIIVSDGIETVKTSFSLTAYRRNHKPWFRSVPNLTTFIGDEVELTVKADDWDDDPLTFRLEGAPEGAEINADGKFTWKVEGETGTYDITVIADDGRATEKASFVLTVSPVADDMKVHCESSEVEVKFDGPKYQFGKCTVTFSATSGFTTASIKPNDDYRWQAQLKETVVGQYELKVFDLLSYGTTPIKGDDLNVVLEDMESNHYMKLRFEPVDPKEFVKETSVHIPDDGVFDYGRYIKVFELAKSSAGRSLFHRDEGIVAAYTLQPADNVRIKELGIYAEVRLDEDIPHPECILGRFLPTPEDRNRKRESYDRPRSLKGFGEAQTFYIHKGARRSGCEDKPIPEDEMRGTLHVDSVFGVTEAEVTMEFTSYDWSKSLDFQVRSREDGALGALEIKNQVGLPVVMDRFDFKFFCDDDASLSIRAGYPGMIEDEDGTKVMVSRAIPVDGLTISAAEFRDLLVKQNGDELNDCASRTWYLDTGKGFMPHSNFYSPARLRFERAFPRATLKLE